MPIVKLLIKH